MILISSDELGRGTATYDGTAIAGAVVTHLLDMRWVRISKYLCFVLSFKIHIIVTVLTTVRARTMFATHYHCLAGEQREGMVAAHMACMVENEGHEDISQENITFLYKLSEGAAPKSHGFNAAKLAGLPHDIIRAGHAKAKQFEQEEKQRELFHQFMNVQDNVGDIKSLLSKLSLVY